MVYELYAFIAMAIWFFSVCQNGELYGVIFVCENIVFLGLISTGRDARSSFVYIVWIY